MYNELIKRQSIYNDDQVSSTFFSQKNTDIIQNMIRHSVYLQTNKQHKISRQSDTELFIIMQSIHKQHGRNMPTHIQEQVDELNNIVTEEATKLIIPRLLQHVSYLENMGNIQVLDYGSNTSSYGQKY